MKNLPVLIVGAGPTGLMMANALASHQIPFRIIDKNSEPTQGSNATWIQARTLEIFDAMGLVHSFLKIGHQCHAFNLYENGKQLATMSLDNINSPYPYILMVPQRETEHLLNKKLAEHRIQVERSHELIDIQQTNNGVVSTIKLSNGNTETITSQWVIACDGANSTIRNKCQIPFPGDDISEQWMVADAKMSSFLSTDEIHVFFDKASIFPDKATIFSAFPWGQDNYRLIANLYNETPRQTFHPHEIKEIVAERTYGNYIIDNISWISPFWIHSKLVDRMQDNSIFLLGDAAHIHSPAGGQGMNTGLQDAYNLAWKIAMVIKNNANASILKSYQEERYPIAKNIVAKTNSLTNMMLFDKTFFHQLRDFSKTISNKEKTKKLAEEMMQLSISYKDSSIIDYHTKAPTHSPKQGERALDVKLNGTNKTLYSYFSHQHTILLFTGKQNSHSEHLHHFIKEANEKFSAIAKLIVISKDTSNGENSILDSNDSIHDAYHIQDTTIYIIRPDTYIGYISLKLDIKNIALFFNHYLTD